MADKDDQVRCADRCTRGEQIGMRR